MSPHLLRIQLFGGLHILLPDNGNIVDVGPRAGALVARLVLEPRRAFTREELVDFLWPDEDVEEGRRRLRQLTYTVRHHIERTGFDGDSVLLSTRASLQLNHDAVGIDTVEFKQAVRLGRQSQTADDQACHYGRAVDLYTGELLPGYYQDVFIAERSRCAEECYRALRGLSRACEQLGDVDRAMDAARRAVELNPTGEEAHCDLMRYHALKGEISGVLRQYREMERILRVELGADPSPASRDLRARLREAESAPALSAPSPEFSPQILHSPPPPPVRKTPLRSGRSPLLSHRRIRLAGLAAAAGVLLCMAVFSTIRFRASSAESSAPPLPPAYRKEPLWVARYARKQGDKDSEPCAIATDKQGNSFVAGFVDTARHDTDILVIKYDRDGKQVWEYRYNGPGNDVDRARCIALDRAGNVYVAGDSDNGNGPENWTRLSGEDFVVIKLGRDGKPSPTWPNVGHGMGVRRYNGPDNGEEMPKKLLLDDSGDVYVMGYSYSRKGDRDWAIVKYDSSTGRRAWTQRHDSPDHDEDCPNDMTLSNDGGLYLTGSSRLRPQDAPEMDILTIKYRCSDGNAMWTRRWGQNNHADDAGQFVFADQWGMVYVAGIGRTAPGTYNHTRSGYVQLTYDQSGKLHRAHGALTENDHIDRVDNAWQNGAIGVREGFFYIVNRDDSGARAAATRYQPFGVNSSFVARTSGRYHYLVGSRPDTAGLGSSTHYECLGVTYAGGITREWTYRGTGNLAALNRAMAAAVWEQDLGANKHQECVFVTGQADFGNTRDIVTLCYRSF